MKQVHSSYSFNASTKTITLTGLNIDQDQLLLVVNATRGVQYFNFADSSLRATVTPGANTSVVLTDASTTGHANGDALVIYYDDQVSAQVVSGTVTANPGTNPFTVTGSVALDNASLVALENITVTVGSSVALAAGSAQVGSVSISNFPSTQTIAGTVTANVFGQNVNGGSPVALPIAFGNDNFPEEGPRLGVQLLGNDGLGVGQGSVCILPISGTVTANVAWQAGEFYPYRFDGDGAPDMGTAVVFQKNDYGAAIVGDNNPLPISGTVTANGFNYDENAIEVIPIRNDGNDSRYIPVGPSFNDAGDSITLPIAGTVTAALSTDTNFNDGGDRLNVGLGAVAGTDPANWLKVDGGSVPISGTVTANVQNLIFEDFSPGFFGVPAMGRDTSDQYRILGLDDDGRLYSSVIGTVTVGNSVTIGSLPAISGTVTASLSNTVTATWKGAGGSSNAVPVVFAQEGQAGGSIVSYDGSNTSLNVNVKGSLPAISGTVTANLSSVPTHGVTIANSSVTVNGTFYQATQPVSIASLPASTVTVSSLPSISGTVTANVASLPKVTLIDGSGSVVTANSAIEVFGTTTTRSYLLVQVTTGSAYVNVGATATTANGIYLASGQGYAWETTIPQGVCSIISTVTGTAYCAKQA